MEIKAHKLYDGILKEVVCQRGEIIETVFPCGAGHYIVSPLNDEHRGIVVDIRLPDGNIIPIVRVEAPDGKDVSIYVYGDTNNEDYTDKTTITKESLANASFVGHRTF